MKIWTNFCVLAFCGVIALVAIFWASGMANAQVAQAGQQANCTGTDSYQTCRHPDGSVTTIRRTANTTFISGKNCQRSERWSSLSRRVGDSVIHEGVARNGQRWSVKEQQVGTTTYYNGVGPNGFVINVTCTPYGCD